MTDYGGYGTKTNYLADSIARKYVKIDDLIEELRENGIALA